MKPRLYKIGNQEKSLPEWSRIYLRKESTLRNRLHNGWGLLDALQTPGGQHQAMLTAGGKTRTLRGWAKHTDLPLSLIKARRKRGCTPEEVVAPRQRAGLTIGDETKPLHRWAAEHGMSTYAFRHRMKALGLSPELALSLPVAKTGPMRKENR